jgi:hypothetical protein
LKSLKTLSFALCALLILGFLLGAAGGSDNPLIPLSWLRGEYKASLLSKADKSISDGMTAAEKAFFGSVALTPPDGTYKIAEGLYLTVTAGKYVELAQGAELTLLSGGGMFDAAYSKGTALDLTAGQKAGAALAAGHRYLVCESSSARFYASAACKLYIVGAYKTDAPSAVTMPFTDVARGQWFFGAAEFAYGNGLFSGTAADKFSPGLQMSRGMLVTVLYRLDGGTGSVSGGAGFSDVANSSMYYYTPVRWASANGISVGESGGKFFPDRSLTRQELVMMIYNYASFKGSSLYAPAGIAAAFPDYDSVPAEAKSAFNWAVYAGIINGKDGKLAAAAETTRAEVAQVFMKFLTLV